MWSERHHQGMLDETSTQLIQYGAGSSLMILKMSHQRSNLLMRFLDSVFTYTEYNVCLLRIRAPEVQLCLRKRGLLTLT